jgi:cell division transport system permease protein
MFVTLSRIIKYGLHNFWRNGWLAVSTISVMILALFVFEGLILFNVVSKTTIQSLQDKIDISVYFKTNASEDEILGVKRTIEGLTEVKEVEYISQEKALKLFRARHADDQIITQTLAELDVNPLLASLNIKANDPRYYSSIAGYLDNPSLANLVEKVTFAQNQLVIERLTRIIDTAQKSGVTVTFFLAIAAVLVTFNTIRLAIYSNSEQIGIMRLVGASNNFIRGPYVVEGIIYGIVAAILSFLIWLPIIKGVSPHVANFIPEINLTAYMGAHFVRLGLHQLLFGVGLGIVSSVVAIRRYLRT